MELPTNIQALNGAVVSRSDIEEMITMAKRRNDAAAIYRLSRILNEHPNEETFEIEVENHPPQGLGAPWHKGSYRKALDSCGRLNPGYRFENGGIVQVGTGKKPKRAAKAESERKPVKKITPKAEKITHKAEKVTPKPKKITPTAGNRSPKSKGETAIKTVAKKAVNDTPKGFDRKPKSVALKSAIDDVLTLPKFVGVKPIQATTLYNILKKQDDLAVVAEDGLEIDSDRECGILKTDGPLHESSDHWLYVKALGFDFFRAVNGRLESLRNQKHNYALFDGLKKPVRKSSHGEKKSGTHALKGATQRDDRPKPGSLAEMMSRPADSFETYTIDKPEFAKFLGKVEIKETHSVVVTLAGGEGSGKTRELFQFMNEFAQHYRCGHASMEEHPASKLYRDKAVQYLNAKAMNNIQAPEIDSPSDLDRLIRDNEVIFIDSFEKMRELERGAEIDSHLRKKYNGKLFFVIFQLTADGKMRGGSKSQYDGDIILSTEKFEDYRQNFVYPTKNRYNDIPNAELKLSIHSGKLIGTHRESEKNEEPQTARLSFKATNMND